MQPPQHASSMIGVSSQSFPTTNVTTEQIQKYLDENKRLILAILENQNLGKLAECAQYQAQLQKNLMYLAAIADAQSQAPGASTPTQMTPQPTMSQGHFMQHPQLSGSQPQQQPQPQPQQPQPQPQAHSQPQPQPQLQPQTQSQSQQGTFPPHMLFPVGAYQPHDQQQISPYIQQQQAMMGSMGMRMGANNGIHPAMLSGPGGAATNQMDLRGRQDGPVEVGPGDGHGKPFGQGGSGSANRES